MEVNFKLMVYSVITYWFVHLVTFCEPVMNAQHNKNMDLKKTKQPNKQTNKTKQKQKNLTN